LRNRAEPQCRLVFSNKKPEMLAIKVLGDSIQEVDYLMVRKKALRRLKHAWVNLVLPEEWQQVYSEFIRRLSAPQEYLAVDPVGTISVARMSHSVSQIPVKKHTLLSENGKRLSL
jgi:hypothetical protein